MEISVMNFQSEDYISLTDLAKHKSDEPSAVIGNWMRNRNTIEYLGLWETLYNPAFKPLEFEGFRKKSTITSTQMPSSKTLFQKNSHLSRKRRCMPKKRMFLMLPFSE